MEGVPATSTDDSPIHQTPPSSVSSSVNKKNNDPRVLARPPARPSRQRSIQQRSFDRPHIIASETYIIQIPKDQIFGVPPPANAVIIDQRSHQKEERSGCKPSLRIAIILIVLGATIGAIIGTFHILFSPQAPGFSVLYVNVKNSPSSNHGKTHVGAYEIGLKAKNPNARMQISYGSNGNATLSYKGHKLCSDEFPALNQDPGGSTDVILGLARSNGPLPLEVERSIGDTVGKEHVSLSLDMNNVPVRLNAAGTVTLWTKIVDVACHFEVSSLGTGKRVLSQTCTTQFQ